MDKVERGRRAEALLGDPLFEDVLQNLESYYIEKWRRGESLQARENAHRYVTLIGRLREDLTSQALTGTLKSKRQAELEGRLRRWR